MLRFIRRLFVLLILFTAVFLVYRYLNPEWASKFVDYVKSVPDKISDFLWIESDVKVNTVDTQISGDVSNLEEENMSWDMDRLEELNNEIEDILWKDSKSDDLDMVEWKDWEVENISWDNKTGVVVDETEKVDEFKTDETKKEDTKNTVDEIKNSDWLSQYDYDQIENVFWNLVE